MSANLKTAIELSKARSQSHFIAFSGLFFAFLFTTLLITYLSFYNFYYSIPSENGSVYSQSNTSKFISHYRSARNAAPGFLAILSKIDNDVSKFADKKYPYPPEFIRTNHKHARFVEYTERTCKLVYHSHQAYEYGGALPDGTRANKLYSEAKKIFQEVSVSNFLDETNECKKTNTVYLFKQALNVNEYGALKNYATHLENPSSSLSPFYATSFSKYFYPFLIVFSLIGIVLLDRSAFHYRWYRKFYILNHRFSEELLESSEIDSALSALKKLPPFSIFLLDEFFVFYDRIGRLVLRFFARF